MTGDAAETLRSREGNCLALASVFVGLARAVGLEARYMDASTRVHETVHGEDGITVTSGHVTAIVDVGKGSVGLDFARMGPVVWYRILDDVEALAHFYNNRGFERVDEARASGAPVDWEAAAADFRRAAQVLPVVRPRLEQPRHRRRGGAGREARGGAPLPRGDAARPEARRAAEQPRRPAPAPRRGDGRARGARGRGAPPSAGPHVLYNLALARLRSGDRAGAVAALRRASGDGYPRARRLLEQLSAPL